MKNTQQKNFFLNKLKEEIENSETTILTTVSLEGKLRSRPVPPLKMDESNTLWFFTNEFSARVNEITKNPLVCICYSNSKTQKYGSVTGEAGIVTYHKKMKELWDPLLQKWFPEGFDDPRLVLLKIYIEEVEKWDPNWNKMIKVSEMPENFTIKENNAEKRHKKLILRGFKRGIIKLIAGSL